MIINQTSKIEDILQAIKGTWSVSTDNGWKCCECGEVKFYKKLCEEGNNVLPETFLKQRNSVVPYMKFEKDKLGGGIIGVQDQYITLDANALVVILMV